MGNTGLDVMNLRGKLSTLERMRWLWWRHDFYNDHWSNAQPNWFETQSETRGIREHLQCQIKQALNCTKNAIPKIWANLAVQRMPKVKFYLFADALFTICFSFFPSELSPYFLFPPKFSRRCLATTFPHRWLPASFFYIIIFQPTEPCLRSENHLQAEQ